MQTNTTSKPHTPLTTTTTQTRAPPATAADPEPPAGAPHPNGGRALWQHGRDGAFKLVGNSPPVAPGSQPPRVWTFNAKCRAGECSALCWEKTRWYDSGRCADSSSGRRFCRCWRAAAGGGGDGSGGGGASGGGGGVPAAEPPAPPTS